MQSKFYPIKGYYIERNRDKAVEYEDNYWDVVTASSIKSKILIEEMALMMGKGQHRNR